MTMRWFIPVMLRAPDGVGEGSEGLGGDEEFDGDESDGFLADILGKEPPKKKTPEELEKDTTEAEKVEEEVTEEVAEEDAETTEEGAETPEDADKKVPEDDTEIDLVVNGETRKVKMSDLKALYGREQEITRTTEAVTAARAEAAQHSERATTALKSLLARAEEKFKPYADLDYLMLSRKLDESAWHQLREDAVAAQNDVKYLRDELDGQMKAAQTVQATARQEAATRAIGVLSGPVDKGGIEGWGEPLYKEILAFAVKEGMPAATASAILDPAAIRLLHRAMTYSKNEASAATKVAKAKADPKKITKPSVSGNAATGSQDKSALAMARLRRSGSEEDAEAAFLASFG